MRKVILIGGVLAAGKSTYANILKDKFNLTVVTKDKLKEILGDNTICNNRDFWDKIIPLDDFTYDDFISIYTEAFRAINLENLLEEL